MSSKAKLHARRRAARYGDLDALLVEALKDNRRGEGAVKRLKGISEHLHEQYTNPDNWTTPGVVIIIYVDEATGQQETIGMFQEMLHRRTQARKLVRVQPDNIKEQCKDISIWSTRQELSTDPYLLGPPQSRCPSAAPANPYERQAIRDYLARTAPPRLDEVLGSKVDAARLLAELRMLGVEKVR